MHFISAFNFQIIPKTKKTPFVNGSFIQLADFSLSIISDDNLKVTKQIGQQINNPLSYLANLFETKYPGLYKIVENLNTNEKVKIFAEDKNTKKENLFNNFYKTKDGKIFSESSINSVLANDVFGDEIPLKDLVGETELILVPKDRNYSKNDFVNATLSKNYISYDIDRKFVDSLNSKISLIRDFFSNHNNPEIDIIIDKNKAKKNNVTLFNKKDTVLKSQLKITVYRTDIF